MGVWEVHIKSSKVQNFDGSSEGRREGGTIGKVGGGVGGGGGWAAAAKGNNNVRVTESLGGGVLWGGPKKHTSTERRKSHTTEHTKGGYPKCEAKRKKGSHK